MSCFGIKNREPIEKEISFMKKWLMIYKMPLNIIKIACEKTIFRVGKPSFAYADTIISDWYKKGVKNIAEIEKLDKEFLDKKTNLIQNNNNFKTNLNQDQNKQINSFKTNKFINYKQPNYDFDALRELEIKLLKEEVGR